MKKIVGVIFTLAVLSFSFVFAFFPAKTSAASAPPLTDLQIAFFPAKTSAASAPPLTDLQIIGITSDGKIMNGKSFHQINCRQSLL